MDLQLITLKEESFFLHAERILVSDTYICCHEKVNDLDCQRDYRRLFLGVADVADALDRTDGEDAEGAVRRVGHPQLEPGFT